MVSSIGGDGAAYRQLLGRLSRHLRAYFNRRLSRFGRRAAESEDLVQEALLAIHTSRHTYDPAEPFTPWVHAIAQYKLIDHMRATRFADASLPIEDADAIIAEVDELAAAESAADLDALLAELPERMRRAIQCVKIEGLSVAEAARRGSFVTLVRCTPKWFRTSQAAAPSAAWPLSRSPYRPTRSATQSSST
jgi:RNA polymerase sigma-70 factor (ECF subfamily)